MILMSYITIISIHQEKKDNPILPYIVYLIIISSLANSLARDKLIYLIHILQLMLQIKNVNRYPIINV